MRNRKKFNQLSRTHSHRAAMLSNMAASLILHKRINTTLAKAKALRMYVEPLITKSKEDTTHSRRVVFSYLQSKEAVTELFREISVKIADRPGGYTRILKTGNRLGDNAEMCLIELVDYNENLIAEKEGKKAKTSRRRRGTGAKKETTPIANATKTKVSKTAKEATISETSVDEVVVEDVVVEDVVVEDAVVEDTVVEDTVVEDVVVEDTVVEDTVVEDAVVEDTVVEEPTAEASTEETEADEDIKEEKPE